MTLSVRVPPLDRIVADMHEAADRLAGGRPDLSARLRTHAETLRRVRDEGARAAKGPRPLTVRQHQLYAFLWSFIPAHGYAPSFDEMAGHMGYSSLATVHEHLTNLERKGWIRRTFNEARAIELLVPLPLKAPEAAVA